jgi:hypothetical protein
MCHYTITLTDTTTQTVTSVDVVGVWKQRISIPSDTQINADTDVGSCTGKCKKRLVTHPEITDRGGNQIQIIDISARPCYRVGAAGKPKNPIDSWIAL